jgi:hypothetical protein
VDTSDGPAQISHSRRHFLGTAGGTAIWPFAVPITPEAELQELRARINATRRPDRELVADHSQGFQLGWPRKSHTTGRKTMTGAGSRRSLVPCRTS